ncbi:MAG: Nif11-like leader peptide family RiPP precursor [Deferribacterales bacterium]
MSVENVKAFFKRIEEEEDFRNVFLKNEKLEKGNPDSILDAAAQAGYPFTTEDLNQAKEELKNSELSEEELQRIAGGGWGAAICFIWGYGFFTDGVAADMTTISNETTVTYGVCFVLGINY